MLKTVSLLLLAVMLVGGCSGMSDTEQRVLSGGAIGAGGGALIGAAAGDSGAVPMPGRLVAVSAPAPLFPVSLAGGFFGPLTLPALGPALLMAFLDPPDLVSAMTLPPGGRIN